MTMMLLLLLLLMMMMMTVIMMIVDVVLLSPQNCFQLILDTSHAFPLLRTPK